MEFGLGQPTFAQEIAAMLAIQQRLSTTVYPTGDGTVPLAKIVPVVAKEINYALGDGTAASMSLPQAMTKVAELRTFSRAVYDSFSQPVTQL